MTDLPPAEGPTRPDPQLIQRLFDEDPLKLSDQDLDEIIQFFRTDRQAYLQAPLEKAKKSNAKKLADASQPPLIPISDDDLKDLGLL